MRRISGATLLLLLSTLFSVFAQTTGSITGTVSQETGAPLPGATVEARGAALQGTRFAVTGADGS